MSDGQRPGPVRRGQQVVFARTERYRRFDQLGKTRSGSSLRRASSIAGARSSAML